MFSLPNIVEMNAEAASKAGKAKIQKQLSGKIPMDCDFCDKPSVSRQLWFDIFSNDAKGVLAMCQECEDNYGSIPEGYFYCETCGKVFIENYTWELYYRQTEDGEKQCLNCAAEEYIEDQDNWIPLNQESIESITFEHLRSAPHLIAVSGLVPKGLRFVSNVEMDSMGGGRITGFSSSESTTDGAVQETKEILHRALNEGNNEALLVLDAAYQFAVSVGVYVRE